LEVPLQFFGVRHIFGEVCQAMLDLKRKVINIENKEGLTPLMITAARGDKTKLKILYKVAKLKLKNQERNMLGSEK
jgi:hypothetical protein